MAFWRQKIIKLLVPQQVLNNSLRNDVKPTASGMGQTGVNATEAVQKRLLAGPVWSLAEAKTQHRTKSQRI